MTILTGFFYRGRHRRPTHTGRNVAIVATTGALALGGAALTSSQAQAAEAPRSGDLDVIAQCESGNQNVKNRSSSASGYWQIIDGTWRANGGTAFAPTAMQATKAEQRIVAERIAARRGSYADWNPSKGCWGSKIGKALPQRATDAPRTTRKPTTTTPRQATVDTGRAADGTGSYTCDVAHLSFDACDPSNLGALVQYPRYDRATGRVTPAAGAVAGKHRKVERGDTLSEIAAGSGTTWRALAEKNGLANPHLIFPGQDVVL
ncbi:transglycosylase family protein [Pseudonocardia sp. NPDC049154]|uniref:LysM peptidoglycan-binding domain-containing protein n=1 Tax=Pseudonocardia sp. NPDC049154 TaxID=3155501 RepID=UPI0033DAA40F